MMRTRICKVLPVAVLVAVLMAATASVVSAQSDQDRIRQQVDEAESRVAGASRQVEEAQQEVDEAQQRVTEAQAQADAATQTYGDAHADLHVIEHEIERVQTQISEASDFIESLRQEVQEVTVERYICLLYTSPSPRD